MEARPVACSRKLVCAAATRPGNAYARRHRISRRARARGLPNSKPSPVQVAQVA